MFCSSPENESAWSFCDIYPDITAAVYKTGREITINIDIDLPSVVYCQEPDQDRRKKHIQNHFHNLKKVPP